MKALLAGAAIVAFALVAPPTMAQMITLGPTTGLQSQPCDEASTGGGQVSLNCTVVGKGTAIFDGTDSGAYTIGAMNAVFGPAENAADTALLASSPYPSQQFTYKSAANYSAGLLTWTALTMTNELLGVYLPTVVTGTPAFVAAFPADGKTTFSAELSLGAGYSPATLLKSPGKSGLVSYSSGDIMGDAKTCHQVTETICD
jgi:hypothetical protein